MGNEEIESCTGCWYAEHGDCSLGNEPCHSTEINKQNWRNDPITEKQEQMIAYIEESAIMNGAFIPPFHGSTKGEASDYIGNYIYACHLAAYNPHEDAGDRD